MNYENGFNALYYLIEYSNKNKDEKPLWWPDNAHISIRYKYDEDFTSSEKNLNLINKTCEMKGLRLMKSYRSSFNMETSYIRLLSR